MNGDRIAGVVFIALATVLVMSGLVARRLPAKRLLSLALLWAGIFGLAFGIARLLR